MTSLGSKCCFTIEVRFESVVRNCKLIARCFCWCERSFDRHKLNVPSNTARMLHQHYLNVINAITLTDLTHILTFFASGNMSISLYDQPPLFDVYMQFSLHSVSWSWWKYVTVHKFTVADSFSFSQFNSSSMSLRWDCASKAPFGKWRWLSIKMMLSFASISPTNAIVKPLIIVKAAFVSVSLLLRWKLRADSSLGLGFLKKQTVNSS